MQFIRLSCLLELQYPLGGSIVTLTFLVNQMFSVIYRVHSVAKKTNRIFVITQ